MPGDFDEEVLELWPDHLGIFRLFEAAQTQWRVSSGMSGLIWTGLDYPAVFALADRLNIAITLEALDQIRVMENEAISIRNRSDAHE